MHQTAGGSALAWAFRGDFDAGLRYAGRIMALSEQAYQRKYQQARELWKDIPSEEIEEALAKIQPVLDSVRKYGLIAIWFKAMQDELRSRKG